MPVSSLPPLNEQLSKETLEDCHTFNDVVVTKTKMHDHHCSVDIIQELKPLDDDNDHDDDDDDDNDDDE